MEETAIEKSVFEEIPKQKIYSEKAIRVGTFLGGPLVAGYFMAENFKAFGESEKAITTWIITIISTLFLFSFISLIPENINIPNIIFPLIYVIIVSYLTKQLQAKEINEHAHNGGEEFTWWRTVAISLVGCVITLALIFGVSFLNETTNGNPTESTKTYGTMKNEITYQSNITENEVDEIAQSFINEAFFDDYYTKYIYLQKINKNYEISISCPKAIKTDLTAQQSFIKLRIDMQNNFPNNKLIFKLVVDNIDNVVKRIE